MNKEALTRIGIKDFSFDFLTVEQLIKRGIIDKPLDGNHGELHPKGEDFVLSGVPFIMASDINDGAVDYVNCKFITRKQADSLRKGFAKNGDVLLTHKATIGRTAIVKYNEQPYVMLTPQVTYYRVRDHQKLHNRYLRYFFESTFFQNMLSSWAGSGSTRAYLGITEQCKLPVILPPITKQKKIAAVLSAYDDLIENNKRRIALLEKMAEEIYREWFVRMRFPGHEKVKVVKGVPEGWHVTKVKPIVSRLPFGRIYRENELLESGQIIVIDQSQSDFLGFYNGEPQHKATPEKPIVLFGDHSCKMLLMTKPFSLAENVIPFVPQNDMPTYFLYHLIKGSIETTEYKRHWTELTNKDVFLPPPPLQQRYQDVVKPHYQNIELLKDAIRFTSKSRDMLLARLISGKLPVENLAIQFPASMQDEATS